MADSKKMDALKDILKADLVRMDQETLSAYSVDSLTPGAVVFPETLEQVSDLVKMAQGEKWALLPWGSGSKMGVGNPPSRLDLVISTTRLSSL
jgi:glycolate oxidase FAD binding subunit